MIVAAWTLLFGAYYLMPLDSSWDGSAAVSVVLALALFVVAVVWQIRSISSAELPVLRAARAIGFLVPLLIVLFSALYLGLDNASAAHFNQRLDHTGAIYFTMTILSTVGFGDIVPVGALARIVVSIQMLLDLIVLGVLVKLIAQVSRSALANAGSANADSDGDIADERAQPPA